MIDKDEYPATAAIEDRCWKILADLWHAPDPSDGDRDLHDRVVGGVHARRARAQTPLAARPPRRRHVDGAAEPRDELSAVQVCWEKFANYWDVEARYVPISEDHKTLDGHDLEHYVDENTIGVVAILGVTYTGMYEPVKEIAAALDRIQAATGLDVPIHIDGTSGAFIAPFVQPKLEWDFRVDRVHSISTSGHKYGLVFPGVGWIVWRDVECLPDDLVFKVSYLGGEMPTFALNFSRPGAQVLLQYYNFLRLGRRGYTAVQTECRDVAVRLSSEIGAMDAFDLWNDGSDIPVFAWRLAAGYTDKWDLHDLSDQLRQRGWLVPAYPMPDDLAAITVQRIVVRNGLSADLADRLMDAIHESVAFLDGLSGPLPRPVRRAKVFNH